MDKKVTANIESTEDLPLAPVLDAVAKAVPDRLALVFRDRRFTFAEFNDRSWRFANALLSQGITIQTLRKELKNWQSGQDHVAILMYNCSEYLECLVGCFKARAVSININYRYVAEEFRYILTNADTKAIIYHARFAPLVSEVLPDIPKQKLLVQISDESGNALLPGAIEYETLLASYSPDNPRLSYSADDLHILYTGGTTGMPKGVLWRQGDFLAAHLGGKRRDKSTINCVEEFVGAAQKSKGFGILPATPFMHGIGQLASLRAWTRGDYVIIPNITASFDPADMLSRAQKEKVAILTIAGDAFARPILEEMDRCHYALESLKYIITSGTMLSDALKARLMEMLPHITIIDAIGATETGPSVEKTTTDRNSAFKKEFRISEHSVVFKPDMSGFLEPGHEGLGWFAIRKHVPLGYLGDPEKTAETFPVFENTRYSITGDRVRLVGEDLIEFYGRDSMTINSGGEKIFVEEVERAILEHEEITDAVVSSRPSERWGSEVVALVSTKAGKSISIHSILEEAGKHIARYKLPKAFAFVEAIPRGANGKADYKQAKKIAGDDTLTVNVN